MLRTRGRFTGKWFAEGKGKRDHPGVSGPWARVKGRVCVGTLVRENRFPVQMKVAPWINNPSFNRGRIFLLPDFLSLTGVAAGTNKNHFL